MEHIEVSRRFEGAPEAVWRRYSDHVSWKEWAGVCGASLEREGTEEPNDVGCIRVPGPPGLAARKEFLGFEPPHCMVYRVGNGPIRGHRGEAELAAEVRT